MNEVAVNNKFTCLFQYVSYDNVIPIEAGNFKGFIREGWQAELY